MSDGPQRFTVQAEELAMQSFPNWSWVPNFASMFVDGLLITLQLLIIGAVGGFALAIAVGLARVSRFWWLNWPSFAFTQVIRGTPLLVQIFLIYYGLGSLLAAIPEVRQSALWPILREGFWYVALALILSVGAYVGEVLRGGLLAVPRGELEAARALGMGRGLVARRIWIPRAIQNLLPTLAGESVLLLKSTALASTVAVTDLLGAASFVRAQTFITYEPLLVVAIVYFCLARLIEYGFRKVEERVPVRRVNT